MANIINYSKDQRWLLVENEGRYFFFDAAGEKPELVTTPGGKALTTTYLDLAERILHDLDFYGLERMSAESVLPWHFTMVENFASMKHEELEQTLDECFIQKHDWTYSALSSNFASVFEDESARIPKIRHWLSKCTHMQMTAACCIGNAYHSINLAYVLAVLVEAYCGKRLQREFEALASVVVEQDFYDDVESVMRVFQTFELYYGIHHNENVYIIEDEEITLMEKPINIEGLTVTDEMLIGRNFYHYTDGDPDAEQPFKLITDLANIEEEPVDEEDGDDDEDDDAFNEYLFQYIPSDCWVKKISGFEGDEEIYYIIALLVEDGKIEGVQVIQDDVTRVGGGMFFIPGMAMPARHSYYEINDYSYPEVVCRELKALSAGRYLKNNFSFIGKKLPQAILSQGGNGGDMTDHTYALQSAFRLAYMHMSITTTEDGTITDFDYSTYQSSGSAYGDMFSRPQGLEDRHEEIVDMLLYILDRYTEEEFVSITES